MEKIDYYSTKYKKLEDLPGVGPATALKLREAGYSTVQALATAPIGELVEKGLGIEFAEKVVAAARKVLAIEFITAEQFMEMREGMQKITTGCRSLDGILNGGFETQSITEFYGEFGSGKSQLCQQAAVTVQLPEERGGLDSCCLYVDTEHVFRPERIIQIAKYLDLDPRSVLKRIIYAEAYTSQHQQILLESCDDTIQNHDIRLIIVDSLTGHFRSEYIGRETLPARQQMLNRFMHKLIRLARAFNAAALVTNQVHDVPTAYVHEVKPIGGHIVGHIAHTRIFLRKGRHNLRIAKIVASPFLPEGEAPIKITENGIVDSEEAA